MQINIKFRAESLVLKKICDHSLLMMNFIQISSVLLLIFCLTFTVAGVFSRSCDNNFTFSIFWMKRFCSWTYRMGTWAPDNFYPKSQALVDQLRPKLLLIGSLWIKFWDPWCLRPASKEENFWKPRLYALKHNGLIKHIENLPMVKFWCQIIH